jgi:hypothetical protein
MSGNPVKRPATKNRPAALGFVTQVLAVTDLEGAGLPFAPKIYHLMLVKFKI